MEFYFYDSIDIANGDVWNVNGQICLFSVLKMKRTDKILVGIFAAILIFFVADNIINWAMMRGVNNYYGLNQPSEILLIGHSHLMLATDKKRLEDQLGMKVSKYCREGVNVTDKKTMVEHFLNSADADSLRYVLYGVDLATFTGDGLSQNSYKLFYPFIDDMFVDSYIRTQSAPLDYWLHKLVKTTRFSDDGLKNSTVRGWFGNWDNLKTNVIDIEVYKRKLANGDERSIQMNEELISQFKETIKILVDQNITVILVNTPTLDLLNEYEPEKYQKIIDWYHQYADKNDNVIFWDFNPEYQSDYSIFSDRLHLNQKGQKVITEEIIERIKNLEE